MDYNLEVVLTSEDNKVVEEATVIGSDITGAADILTAAAEDIAWALSTIDNVEAAQYSSVLDTLSMANINAVYAAKVAIIKLLCHVDASYEVVCAVDNLFKDKINEFVEQHNEDMARRAAAQQIFDSVQTVMDALVNDGQDAADISG